LNIAKLKQFNQDLSKQDSNVLNSSRYKIKGIEFIKKDARVVLQKEKKCVFARFFGG